MEKLSSIFPLIISASFSVMTYSQLAYYCLLFLFQKLGELPAPDCSIALIEQIRAKCRYKHLFPGIDCIDYMT